MKKLLSLLILIISILIIAGIYFLDKQYFLCPIYYKWDMVIRSDSRGEGFFAANRSGNRSHNGIDLQAQLDTPVLASRFGKVVFAGRNNGMGNYVILSHAGGVTTIYGHLNSISVREGQFLRQGEIIGTVGKTGNAKYQDIQPHLHFEVRKNRIPQDPLNYLK